MAGVPPGTVKVKVLAPDYHPLETEVEIKKGMVADVVFRVELLAKSPYMTVVRGRREQEVVARYTVSQREMTTVPGSFGDPARVVQNLPGVARSPYTLGLLLVRGSYPQDSNVYLDGVRIPLLYHFMGGPSVLNPEFLERIDFYPGNFGVKFGRTGGGIIDVETSSGTPEIWNGMIDVNLFFASGFVEVPLTDKVSLKLGLRRSYYDLIIPLIQKAAGATGTTVVPVYYDYQARLDVDLDNDDHLHVMFFGSDDQFDLASGEKDAPDAIDLSTQTSFHRVMAKHLLHITPNLTSTMVPYVGYDIMSFDFGLGSMNFRTWSAGIKEDLDWRVHPRLTLRPGLDFVWQRSTYKAFFPAIQNYTIPGQSIGTRLGGPPTTFDQSGEKQEINQVVQGFGLGLYLEALWTPVDRLKLIPGVRFDSYFYMGRRRYSGDPRLTIRVDVGGGVTLKGGAGLFHQLPAEYMLDPEYGNPDLKLEWSEQYSLGVEWRFLEVWLLDIQGFYVRWHDRAISTDKGSVSNGVFSNDIYSNAGWGRSYGMEFLFRHDVTDFFYGWIAYTLSRSETIPYEGWPLSLSSFDQTHILTLVASFNVGRGWEIGTRFRLVSGNPRTPVEQGTFVGFSGSYNPLRGRLNSDRNPLFHQLDLRIEKTWKLKYGTFSMYLDIQNIYYAKNVEFTIYDYRYRNAYEIPGLTILPTLGLKGRF
ncbi:MAG: TonB-dependent receptor, partial [Deltaproteobacteria bacterium]|nr:TonB-dependent receptor [Deltaproteobacteria bacterium]